MSRALLIVDIQNDYFPGGAYPLVAPEAAADATAKLLAAFRASGETVIHMRHVWDAPEASFMRPGTYGVEIHHSVAPIDGEVVLQKSEPNSFLGTGLADTLDAQGVDHLVVAGMMTSMCIDSTVRAAADRGLNVQLVHDACAAPDLEFGATLVPGAQVHAAFVAALGDGFAELVSVDDFSAR